MSAAYNTETLHALIQELRTDLKEMRADVRELYTLVKGNGRPGLRETQATVEQLRVDVALDRSRRESWVMFILRPVVGIIWGMIFAGMILLAQNGGIPK